MSSHSRAARLCSRPFHQQFYTQVRAGREREKINERQFWGNIMPKSNEIIYMAEEF